MRFSSGEPPSLVLHAAHLADRVFKVADRFRRAVKGYATANEFARRGNNFVFDPDGIYSYSSIYVGSHVNLGVKPTLLATRGRILIGDHVMFGPNVSIRGGNHRFDIVGVYMDEVTEDMKRPEDDLGVVIEDDVWIGGGATILHGVTIGRGSIIGAAAVVTKSIPPYSIAAGNPARVIRPRWDSDKIQAHETALTARKSARGDEPVKLIKS